MIRSENGGRMTSTANVVLATDRGPVTFIPRDGALVPEPRHSMMAALSDRPIARSRFQAGALAAHNGWL